MRKRALTPPAALALAATSVFSALVTRAWMISVRLRFLLRLMTQAPGRARIPSAQRGAGWARAARPSRGSQGQGPSSGSTAGTAWSGSTGGTPWAGIQRRHALGWSTARSAWPGDQTGVEEPLCEMRRSRAAVLPPHILRFVAATVLYLFCLGIYAAGFVSVRASCGKSSLTASNFSHRVFNKSLTTWSRANKHKTTMWRWL